MKHFEPRATCEFLKRTADAVFIDCRSETEYNVLHGFEGELDVEEHRSTRFGRRFEGLPWERS